MKEKLQVIQIRLSKQQLKEIDASANDFLMNRSQYIRKAVQNQLDVESYIKDQMANPDSYTNQTRLFHRVLMRVRQGREYDHCTRHCRYGTHVLNCKYVSSGARPEWLRYWR